MGIGCFIASAAISTFVISASTKDDSLDEWDYINYEPELYDLVLLYVGSSTCGFCQDEELHNSIREINSKLFNLASDIDSLSYFAIGISKDYNVNNGYKHLLKIGIFNEVMVGNSWNNTGLSRYFFVDFPALPATPHIALIIRKKNLLSSIDSNDDFRGIEFEQVLRRFYGKLEIASLTYSDDSELLELIQSNIK